MYSFTNKMWNYKTLLLINVFMKALLKVMQGCEKPAQQLPVAVENKQTQ